MKSVYIFRHGDAEKNDNDPDYARKLTIKGVLRTVQMAEHIRDTGYVIDLIISSGATRAKGTAVIIAQTTGYNQSDIRYNDILYTSKKASEIVDFIGEMPEEKSSVMLIGHNPLLNSVALNISNSGDEFFLQKSSMLRIDFDTDSWKAVAQGTGRTVFYKTFSDGEIINCVDDSD